MKTTKEALYKVIIWGYGKKYNEYLNLIKNLEEKEIIKVIAVMSNDSFEGMQVDQYIFLSKEYALKQEYDYCLVALDDWENVKKEALELGIPEDKLIPIRVLSIPYFDFEKYIKIKESKPSILSRNCWAGLCYHYLGLEFLTPTINCFFSEEDFNRFAERLDYYLELPIEYKEMGFNWKLNINYPIGQLGDIQLNFNHYTDFDHAKDCWERRKKRINRDNLLFVSSSMSKSIAKEFDELPYENKIIFVPFQNDLKSNFCIASMLTENDTTNTIGEISNRIANGNTGMFDLLAFISHEKEYMRITK